jgi:hypothetical protein
MEIENLIRYAELAVGLKPSAIECEARLRGLERNNYSKTIQRMRIPAFPSLFYPYEAGSPCYGKGIYCSHKRNFPFRAPHCRSLGKGYGTHGCNPMIQRCCTLRALRLLRRSFEITSLRCSHNSAIGEDQIATHKRALNSSGDAHPLEGGISLR